MYYATYHGLHKWHEHMFTHLGWMILADKHGYHTKVKAYMEGIKHLHKALVEGIHATNDSDRERDLEILLHNVVILEQKAQTILKHGKRSKSGSKKRKTRRSRK